jgi:hypothetical protein
MESRDRRLLLLSLLAGLPGRTLLAAAARRRSTSPVYTVPRVILPASASDRDRLVADACERALGGARGAVVAMDPWNGRVIAVVNPSEALFRAYQPCSVFKIVVAIGGLSEGVITPETTYTCDKGCWMWPGHGPINLRRALAVSCNPYFQWVGQQLGFDKVQHYAHLLGLGERSGINLAGETAGVVPARVRPQDVALLSSHAEGIATSAVQLGVLISSVINGGIVFQPQVGAAPGFTPKERWRLPESTQLSGLQEGFLGAVNEGSALPAFDPDVVVAGVGAAPETSLAEAAGIEVADGIAVDARFATSAPDVFAAGDCCRYPHPLYDDRPLRLESWRAAQEHGTAAARAMLGGTEPYAGVPWFWTDQHDYTLQVAGLTDTASGEVVRARPDGTEIWFGLADGGRLVAAAAAGRGNSVARDIKLAEMLIARRAAPDPAALADPGVALKSVLRSPVAG